ncbi:MAG TPA: hypothetical protein VN749_11430 [Candidatus Eisenbacteria bacterium]|nr:hypothetical protein [Candidatus Eisenbacteria bacterium]
MNKVDVATEIGDVLTTIDALLSDPEFSPSSPKWQQLFALRKHLDDQQRELVQEIFAEDSPEFDQIAKQLGEASDSLEKVAGSIAKLGTVLKTVSSIASLADKILSLAL